MAKSVLIIGGAGFIGSHVARELQSSGYGVMVIDARRAEDIRRALTGIDVVFLFPDSLDAGRNMHEAATLLQLLTGKNRDAVIQRLIVASSRSIYGEGSYRDRSGRRVDSARRSPADLEARRWEPLGEDGHPMEPIPTSEDKPADLASFHALSRYDLERLCLMTGAAYGFQATVLRFFDVYGPGHAFPHGGTGIVPELAARLLNGRRPTIPEDGNQRRDFVHVSDAAHACRLAMERPEAGGQVFNVGTGRSHTVAEVARLMAAAIGRPGIQPEITGTYRQGDIRHCFADVGKARRLLGFEASVTLGDGIGELARWLTHQDTERLLRTAENQGAWRGLAI